MAANGANVALFGEIETAKTVSQTIPGHVAYDAFGLYAVGVTISKAGYGEVHLLCANADDVKRLRPPSWSFRMPLVQDKNVNVQQYPNQRVVLSRIQDTPSVPLRP